MPSCLGLTIEIADVCLNTCVSVLVTREKALCLQLSILGAQFHSYFPVHMFFQTRALSYFILMFTNIGVGFSYIDFIPR